MEADKSKSARSAFEGYEGRLPDWPFIVPDTVGVFGAQAPGGASIPGSMTIVLDLEGVPGLAEAVDRHQKGEVFEIETRWAVTNSPEDDSPTAVLSAYLTEIGLGFNIEIIVDIYSEALLAAARTKWVTIVDPELHSRLLSQSPFKAMESGRSMAFGVEDNEPLLYVLMQRLDLPRKAVESEPAANAPGEADETDAEFVEGGTPAIPVAILMPPDDLPAVVLVDPGVGNLRERLAPDADLEGRWAVRVTDGGPIARLDCSLEGERIASWLIPAPVQELVRVTASGPHVVAVLVKFVQEDDSEAAAEQAREGVLMTVGAATEAMLPILDSTRPD
jgi:hypothetical protein